MSTVVAVLLVRISTQSRCGILVSVCSVITACESAWPEMMARTLSPCTAAVRGRVVVLTAAAALVVCNTKQPRCSVVAFVCGRINQRLPSTRPILAMGCLENFRPTRPPVFAQVLQRVVREAQMPKLPMSINHFVQPRGLGTKLLA